MPKAPPDVAISELYCCVIECVANGELTQFPVNDDLLARARAATNLALSKYPWLAHVIPETGNYETREREMTETKYLYKIAARLHWTMTDAQRARIEEFMKQHDALMYYNQLAMPDPSLVKDAEEDEESFEVDPDKLEEHATTMAIVLSQLIDMDALEELYESLGVDWSEVFDLLKEKLGLE